MEIEIKDVLADPEVILSRIARTSYLMTISLFNLAA